MPEVAQVVSMRAGQEIWAVDRTCALDHCPSLPPDMQNKLGQPAVLGDPGCLFCG